MHAFLFHIQLDNFYTKSYASTEKEVMKNQYKKSHWEIENKDMNKPQLPNAELSIGSRPSHCRMECYSPNPISIPYHLGHNEYIVVTTMRPIVELSLCLEECRV